MKKIIVFFIYLTMGINILFAQDIESNIKERLTDYFNKYTATAKISTPKLNSFDIDYDRKQLLFMPLKALPTNLFGRKP